MLLSSSSHVFADWLGSRKLNLVSEARLVTEYLVPYMKPYWSGVFPAITTQLHKDGSIDLDGTSAHVEVLIASGIKGLIFLGSLGENQRVLCARIHAYLSFRT